MAAVSQVQDALVGLIVAAIYPNGTPPAGASAVGHPVKVYPGWPNSQQLDADVIETAGKPAASHVSVYPLPAERNTTRYPNERVERPLPAATYTLAIAGQALTVGGAAPNPYSPQNLAVSVDGTAYVVQAAAGQTPSQVAAALRALIVASVAGVTVAGPVLTFPAGRRLGAARVGVTGATVREVRRQERQFQIAVWTSRPELRSAIADTFDPILADTPRISLADGTKGRLIYHGSREDDFSQKQRIYRRSLIYAVEFATTITEGAPQLIAPTEEMRDAGGNLISSLSPVVTP